MIEIDRDREIDSEREMGVVVVDTKTTSANIHFLRGQQ